jgi:hypothetical protein
VAWRGFACERSRMDALFRQTSLLPTVLCDDVTSVRSRLGPRKLRRFRGCGACRSTVKFGVAAARAGGCAGRIQRLSEWVHSPCGAFGPHLSSHTAQ